jgi:hypothetical protein
MAESSLPYAGCGANSLSRDTILTQPRAVFFVLSGLAAAVA